MTEHLPPGSVHLSTEDRIRMAKLYEEVASNLEENQVCSIGLSMMLSHTQALSLLKSPELSVSVTAGICKPCVTRFVTYMICTPLSASNRSISRRIISRLPRQNSSARRLMPKRAASFAASAIPVDESNSS